MPKVGTVTTKTFEPYWQTTDEETVRLYQGDVLESLKRLPTGSVQTTITSPPYWGLRDYGTGTWTGGDPKCDHLSPPLGGIKASGLNAKRDPKTGHLASDRKSQPNLIQYKDVCGKCGATRTDHQLGSERIPDCLGWAKGENCAEKDWASGCHVCRMVLVFREIRRVMRDDGTLWLNYGDTYASTGTCGGSSPVGQRDYRETDRSRQEQMKRVRSDYGGLKSGNLCGIPWRVALALQADGWVLRQDICWFKPSPMPESVQNRCTKAHEYVFLLTKGMKYFYDAEAIKEGIGELTRRNTEFRGETVYTNNRSYNNSNEIVPGKNTDDSTSLSGRNKRSVWSIDDNRALFDYLALHNPELLEQFLAEQGYKSDVWRIASQGYPGAHYATFPPKLIEPMVLAGSSEYGCCAAKVKKLKLKSNLTAEQRVRLSDFLRRKGVSPT